MKLTSTRSTCFSIRRPLDSMFANYHDGYTNMMVMYHGTKREKCMDFFLKLW